MRISAHKIQKSQKFSLLIQEKDKSNKCSLQSNTSLLRDPVRAGHGGTGDRTGCSGLQGLYLRLLSADSMLPLCSVRFAFVGNAFHFIFTASVVCVGVLQMRGQIALFPLEIPPTFHIKERSL